jgi:hypothetical protein
VEPLVGLLGLILGTLLCFRGYTLMRLLLALLGGLAGFSLGASVVAHLTGSEPLDDPWGWLGALVGAVLLGVLAYAFWAVSVVLGMASLGFLAAVAVLAAVDVDSPWLTLSVGIAGGALFGFLAVIGNLPAMILVVVTAASGAGAIIDAVLVLAGRIRWEDLTRDSPAPSLSWWWFAGYLTLAVLGVLVQARRLSGRNRAIRQNWSTNAPGDV